MNKKKICISMLLLQLCVLSGFGQSYNLNDVWTAYDSFNQHLLDSNKRIIHQPTIKFTSR